MNEKFIFFIIFSINCYLIRCINATENAEIIEGILIGGEEYIKQMKQQKLTQNANLKLIQDEIDSSEQYYKYVLMLLYKYDPSKTLQLSKKFYRMFLEEIYVLPICLVILKLIMLLEQKYTKLQILSMQTLLDEFVETKNDAIPYTEIKTDIMDLGFITFFEEKMDQQQKKQSFMDELKKFTQKEMKQNSTNSTGEVLQNSTDNLNETNVVNENQINESINISEAVDNSSSG